MAFLIVILAVLFGVIGLSMALLRKGNKYTHYAVYKYNKEGVGIIFARYIKVPNKLKSRWKAIAEKSDADKIIILREVNPDSRQFKDVSFRLITEEDI